MKPLSRRDSSSRGIVSDVKHDQIASAGTIDLHIPCDAAMVTIRVCNTISILQRARTRIGYITFNILDAIIDETRSTIILIQQSRVTFPRSIFERFFFQPIFQYRVYCRVQQDTLLIVHREM